jgi:Periplasmic component of the Tol biopolymer transport system
VVFAKIIDSVSLDERLFILGPDSAVKLLDTHGNSLSARWSPDGSRLVFQCDRPKIEAICVVNVDGTGLLQLSDDRYVTRSPEWSPDGTQIAFATNQFASANSPYQQDIAIMNANGSGARRLATGFDPAWSPDGSMLVYAGNNGLFTIRADGSNSTRLTTGSHHAPAWR